jgi:hypothetical protein
MSLTPANLVFGREFHFSCDLLFRAPTDKKWPTTDRIVKLAAWPAPRATRRVTKYSCIAQPIPKESHPSFNHHERAHTG